MATKIVESLSGCSQLLVLLRCSLSPQTAAPVRKRRRCEVPPDFLAIRLHPAPHFSPCASPSSALLSGPRREEGFMVYTPPPSNDNMMLLQHRCTWTPQSPSCANVQVILKYQQLSVHKQEQSSKQWSKHKRRGCVSEVDPSFLFCSEREPNVSEHHSIQPAHTPPTTTTTTLPCIFQPSNETLGAAETLSYHRTAAQWWAAPAATEQIFTDVGGGDRLKEDAAVSMRASFISKIQFIHACLSASSHCNIYIHGGTSHPFPPFHLVPFSPSIMPTSRLCTQSSTQTLTATWAFIAQTALHLSRGGERGGRGERGSGTRAFFCLKRHLRLLRWEAGLQRNIKHLRLRGEEQRETMKLWAVCQMTSYLRVIPSH